MRTMRTVTMIVGSLVIVLIGGTAAAQVPGEVDGLGFAATETMVWLPAVGAEEYNVYAGSLSRLRTGVLLQCQVDTVGETLYQAAGAPLEGEGLFYLVTARAETGEGTPGADSAGYARNLLASCDTVLRQHVTNRVGFGWDEWTRDRVAALGLQGFIDEQLDPASIDEATNTELLTRLSVVEPPQTVNDLQAIDLVTAVYGRRQLEQQVTLFWTNHFNTEYLESYRFFFKYRDDPVRRRLESITLHYDELEQFRARAFNGNFRELLEDSALSRAMNIYLDTDNNVAGRPNENYARELLELHTMGVDGGYTHHEIDSVARVMTGWNVCKKLPADAANRLGPCIANSLIGTVDEPAGEWVINFRTSQHDCGAKVLFLGSGYETVIPDTCATPSDGMQDLSLALDAIAAHPSTIEYISTKLLQNFVTEEPTPQMLANVAAVWNDPANPHGIGDLREILREVLAQLDLLDIDAAGSKIKTPFEHVASAFRAVRGQTNGTNSVRNYLKRMSHLLHENSVPTGYPEAGGPWLDTNNVLERLNFGMDMAARTGANFGTDLIVMLQDNGVPTTVGHATEIVDFFVDALFGGSLTADERRAAIDYLNTDDSGLPGNYNNARVRETVGFMLGYAQFLEQ
jgi:uncharacterized protein (DUF1800 family)